MATNIVADRNLERVEFAEKALLAGEPDSEMADGKPCVYQDTLVDLLTNLCHLAHREGVDIENAFGIALNHFYEEV